jgi:NAD(P)-dependent dehydrogenase (short-subunit alcohol dehydrogenase family)
VCTACNVNPRPKELNDVDVCWVVAYGVQFYRYKTPNHPHTNMAKAALNMMTRTSADDYRKQGIYMNSVDTGCACKCRAQRPRCCRAPTVCPWKRDLDPSSAANRGTTLCCVAQGSTTRTHWRKLRVLCATCCAPPVYQWLMVGPAAWGAI